MAKTWTARSMQQAREMVRVANDGDTIRLVWDGACKASALVVESHAIGLGLDVVVVVGERVTDQIER